KIRKLIAGFWMAQLIRNLRRLDKFVVLSYEDKQKWHELANVSVIYNPIARYPEVISDCSSKKVISAGRFENQKGFDMLIKSWSIVSKRYPDWNLEIYGSGDKSSYNKLVEENNIGNSCMLMEAVQNLNEKFTESSIFAFSSRFEGFGMVITEAMACGLPPVAFACPCGPRDIIEDGVNGLLAEPGNIEDLANKLSLLMEDSEMRKEMGKQARVRSERFSIEIIAVEWDELFHSLTEVKSNVRHSS
ncbi:MAG: glycosyltransferase family 4 protein, partial [Bacteroidales bacterium]